MKDGSRPRPRWHEENQGRAKRSQKHEKRLAEEAGGRALPRSGGLPFSRRQTGKGAPTDGGDYETQEFLYEHKSTENASLGLKLEWLRKVTAGAARKLKLPALVVTFVDKRNRPIEEWVMVRKEDFYRMVDQHGSR